MPESQPGRAECTSATCKQHATPFEFVDGQCVLVDFDESVLEREEFKKRRGASVIKRDPGNRSLRSRIRAMLLGTNPVASNFSSRIKDDLLAASPQPTLLVIGGGAIGSGAAALYNQGSFRVIGLDIYPSDYTTFVADAHRLPLATGSVDAVWIQAVLEHVIDPQTVVGEIHRVLKPEGLVFADTPFMQQVHEGAYDFTRFTLNGHRWLFKRFALIDAGYVGGPGTVLRWSVAYLFRAIFRSNRVGNAFKALFFLLRYLDGFAAGRYSADAACGVFFYGRRSDHNIGPKDVIRFYSDQTELLGKRSW